MVLEYVRVRFEPGLLSIHNALSHEHHKPPELKLLENGPNGAVQCTCFAMMFSECHGMHCFARIWWSHQSNTWRNEPGQHVTWNPWAIVITSIQCVCVHVCVCVCVNCQQLLLARTSCMQAQTINLKQTHVATSCGICHFFVRELLDSFECWPWNGNGNPWAQFQNQSCHQTTKVV